MKMQNALLVGSFALSLAVVSPYTVAQKSSDVDGVKAANQAFYDALSARSVDAMQKVWSGASDIQNVGPRSKAIDTGWPALKKNFEGTFANFAELKVIMEQPRIKVNGNTAWVSGIEKAQRKSKAGEASSATNFGTSIFVKEDGRWKMVYHHASGIAQ
jgi:ketosteroid isomerase-like protein